MSKKDDNKQQSSMPNLWQDDHFYYIAGYTSGGAPFGITWEEHRQIEEDQNSAELTEDTETNSDNDLSDQDIPF